MKFEYLRSGWLNCDRLCLCVDVEVDNIGLSFVLGWTRIDCERESTVGKDSLIVHVYNRRESCSSVFECTAANMVRGLAVYRRILLYHEWLCG